MQKLPCPVQAVLALVVLGSAEALAAQSRTSPFPAWHAELQTPTTPHSAPSNVYQLPVVMVNSETRFHTLTGLLIGGLVGAAATGIFLAGFCSDPDTQCGADEVGRAVVVIIAVPPRRCRGGDRFPDSDRALSRA